MTKINREKLIEAMVGIRTDEAHAREWTAEFADMILAVVEPADAENLRLHAINLAVALHKDSIRFVIKEEQPAPDTAGIVLATADRFNEWLNGAASTEFIGAAE